VGQKAKGSRERVKNVGVSRAAKKSCCFQELNKRVGGLNNPKRVMGVWKCPRPTLFNGINYVYVQNHYRLPFKSKPKPHNKRFSEH